MTAGRFLGMVTMLTAFALYGCATEPTEDEAEEVTSTESAELGATSNVTTAINYALRLRGKPYGWWYSGPIPAAAPMWASNAPAPPPSQVSSTNCAGLTNLMLRSVGRRIPGAGGTGAYGSYYANVAERFNVSKSYPAGTLIGRYYRNTYDQGHVAVVLGNGRVLQSFPNVRGGAYPGVNDRYTVAQSHAGYYYEYAVLPQHWLGTGTTAASGGQCAAGDGTYCGGNGVTGARSTLYRCSGGVATVQQACANGCIAEKAGTNDYCATVKPCRYGDGLYCGGNGVPGHASTLYQCKNGNATASKTCASGCARMPAGTNDSCR